jgi:hypothetical protein
VREGERFEISWTVDQSPSVTLEAKRNLEERGGSLRVAQLASPLRATLILNSLDCGSSSPHHPNAAPCVARGFGLTVKGRRRDLSFAILHPAGPVTGHVLVADVHLPVHVDIAVLVVHGVLPLPV